MSVRPRRRRVQRNALTLRRYMALTIGPRDTDEPLAGLQAVCEEHRHRRCRFDPAVPIFDDDSWAANMFERGIDTCATEEWVGEDDEDVAIPGL